MTIVIPYKTEVLNGEELKYALRSIEKNLTGWKNLVIIGTPPTWFNGLNFIECEDIPVRKEYSCYRKLLVACGCEYISENFVYWNDDHWLLQKLDVSEIKNWHNGPLAGEIKKPHTARWRMAAEWTDRILKETMEVITPLNFDIHRPIIFNKEIFKNIFEDLIEVECCIKSYYVNATYEPFVKHEFAEDCNLSSGLTYDEIKKAVEGKLFCSSKQGITKEYLRVLEELFPNKSKFEK